MYRDETVFPDPEAFDPERFIGSSPEADKARDVMKVVWGWGRRFVISFRALTCTVRAALTRMVKGLSGAPCGRRHCVHWHRDVGSLL